MRKARSHFCRWTHLVIPMWLAITNSVLGQSAVEPIRILGITRGEGNVSFEWQGGFPPYRVRVNNGTSSNWTELPNFINSLSFTASATAPMSLFQVRTESEPL